MAPLNDAVKPESLIVTTTSSSDNPNQPFSSIRSRTNSILSSLNDDDNEDDATICWLRPNTILPADATRQCRYFHKNGFLHIPQFASANDVQNMKHQMKTLVNDQWHPGGTNDDDDDEYATKATETFRTDDGNKVQGRSDYFLDSADKVHFFAEADAVDEKGRLKEEFWDDKMSALNKSGHGLHIIPGAFHEYATSDKIRSLVKSLGYVDPVIPQSMYIFKQARIGGVVTSHQDSTFLYTTPRQSCLGLWLALDDATLDNGCLWIRPKSHLEPLRRRFSRNDDYFQKNDPSQPKMIMHQENESPPDDDNDDVVVAPWDGGLPEDSLPLPPAEGLFRAGFVPVECRKGDLVAFPGSLDHLSLPNSSRRARHTFQLHLVEGKGAGVEWAETNWLQYPDGRDFLGIN